MSGQNVVEKRILTLLSREIMSTSQVAKKLNMRRELTAGYLEALRHQGKLEKTKVGKSNIYRTIAAIEGVDRN
ncbi:MAG: hypothetical protein QT00_C0002G0320 [archaeon GW2011_AR5]|nr:MAG: hypothetical protein QT00_C0002G0320 [archaeon GW2011_AR5]MBS3051611.1 hypothetical protein [Candidatus Aenigmarchaeota archaeon]